MFKINSKLAVHGFDWNWTTMQDRNVNNHEYDNDYGVIINRDFDRTGNSMKGKDKNTWTIVDCRILYDDRDNHVQFYRHLIDKSIDFLINDERVVCCCSAGQSRSNAIALGILIKHFNMDFYDAWELIKLKNPYSFIGMQHITALKRIFKITLP